MHHKFEAMEPKTEFGKWLYVNMVEHECTCADVAKKLYVTRQTVSFHISGRVMPNYPFVIAYCSIFGGNPEEIWKLVLLERGWS